MACPSFDNLTSNGADNFIGGSGLVFISDRTSVAKGGIEFERIGCGLEFFDLIVAGYRHVNISKIIHVKSRWFGADSFY